MVKKRVVWDEFALTALKEAYTYIRKDSLQQAEKVKQEIIASTKALADHPEKYPPDKYRKDNDTRFRAFEKHNYRISYFIAEETIRVLRVRHVKMQPKEY
jgi:plasmid stabilization system protein ParE